MKKEVLYQEIARSIAWQIKKGVWYDNPTIGMLLCRDKDRVEVEYALQNISSPIGVSEFNVKELLPENLKSKLPTVEKVEEELKRKAIFRKYRYLCLNC